MELKPLGALLSRGRLNIRRWSKRGRESFLGTLSLEFKLEVQQHRRVVAYAPVVR